MHMDNADLNAVGAMQGWHVILGILCLLGAVIALIGTVVLALLQFSLAAVIGVCVVIVLIGLALGHFEKAKDLEPVGL